MPQGKNTTITRLPWRRIVGNGVLFGVIASLHLFLFVVLIAMRPRFLPGDMPWHRGNDVALEVRWVAVPSVARASSPARSVMPRGPSRPTHRPSINRGTSLSSAASTPHPAAASVPMGDTSVPGDLPQAAAANDFGDPSIRRALNDDASGAAPALPGGSDASLSRAFRVAQPPSLKDRVKSVGNYMNCSIVEMARIRPGQLNVVRIGEAYSALGCKK